MKKIVSFWGGPLSSLERLAISSMIYHGHEVEIYSYDSPEAFGDFSKYIIDAGSIIGTKEHVYRYYRAKRFNTFSNAFRARLLRKGRGIWSDLDCIFLRPLNIDSEFIFGFSDDKKVNGNILLLPHDSPALLEYEEALSNETGVMPWLTARRRVKRFVQRYILKKSEPDINQKTNTGPRALTYFLTKHDLVKYAFGKVAFNLIPSNYEALERVLTCSSEDLGLTPDVIVLHLWGGKFKRSGMLNRQPNPGSCLEQLQKKYNLADT